MEAMDLVALQRIFQGRSVMITGHTGFKGSWLSLWLSRWGAHVHGYAMPPPTVPNNFELAGVKNCLTSHVDGDVRDAPRLAAACTRAKPDVIFHLASQSLVRESYRAPADTFDVNVMGCVRLLESVRNMNRPCAVIVVTSDKCYDNRNQVWGYRECDPMGGTDPYSASKGATELVTAAYRQSFFPPARLREHGVRLATARAGNVIGGGDWAVDRVVPDTVRALTAGRSVSLRNPKAIRPWQHVLEPLYGYLMLAARLLTDDDPRWLSGWNFGPRSGDELAVSQLVTLFIRAWGSGEWVDASDPLSPYEAECLRLSTDKAMTELGWRPQWSAREAIERTATWYRQAYDREFPDMQQTCWNDIAAYESLLARQEYLPSSIRDQNL